MEDFTVRAYSASPMSQFRTSYGSFTQPGGDAADSPDGPDAPDAAELERIFRMDSVDPKRPGTDDKGNDQ